MSFLAYVTHVKSESAQLRTQNGKRADGGVAHALRHCAL